MDLSIGIVSTDEKSFLERCLEHIYENIPPTISYEVIVIDNHSTDGTSEYIKVKHPKIELLINDSRKGFALNRNILTRRSVGNYFLILDANAFITRGYIEELINILDNNKNSAIASGKLLKADINGMPVLGPNGKHMIDSTGHIINKSYNVLNRGEMEEDNGQFDRPSKIFGVCTAATLFKREALEKLNVFNEYFDEEICSHKEDVDICWRADLYGYDCMYTSNAVAFHCRSWPRGKKRANISRNIKINSFRNRYFLIIKNESPINFLLNLPFILLYEIGALFYVLLREPYLFKAYFEVIKYLPFMLKKRQIIMARKKTTNKAMREWFI
jgi:GT2 family glycosyltransferase